MIFSVSPPTFENLWPSNVHRRCPQPRQPNAVDSQVVERRLITTGYRFEFNGGERGPSEFVQTMYINIECTSILKTVAAMLPRRKTCPHLNFYEIVHVMCAQPGPETDVDRRAADRESLQQAAGHVPQFVDGYLAIYGLS